MDILKTLTEQGKQDIKVKPFINLSKNSKIFKGKKERLIGNMSQMELNVREKEKGIEEQVA